MVTDTAVCVRAWDWSETSQTLWIFTRSLGLLRCVAKGSKRANSAFSGGVELLTRGDVVVSTRAIDKGSQAMTTLAAWDLAEIFPGARATLGSFHVGMAMLDFVQHAMHENDPHEAVFDTLVTSLRDLGEESRDVAALARLAWTILVETGHTPELTRDVRADADLAPAASYAFSPRLGGFTRDESSLAPSPAPATTWTTRSTVEVGPLWRVRGVTLDALRALAAGTTPTADAATTKRAAKLLLMYFREVFACEPKAIGILLDRWEK
ncbi:MAG TPA: DNA repair protein RecO [Phycisphaerales bacterium]|nr:DNA repair protein RecO [Phycisphaerales bacterium]